MDGWIRIHPTGEQLSINAHWKEISSHYLVNKSNRLLASPSAHQGSLSVSPVILASATACLPPDVDLASTPPH